MGGMGEMASGGRGVTARPTSASLAPIAGTSGFPDRHAGSTHAVGWSTGRAIRVRFVVRMSSGAVRLAGVDRRRCHSTPVVLGMADKREMPDVHTHPSSTEVVDFESVRNRATLELPGDTMNVGLASIPSSATDDSVAVAVVGPKPEPTVIRTAFLNPTPETDGNRGWFTSTLADSLGLTRGTEAATVGPSRRVGRIHVSIPASRDCLRPRLAHTIRCEPFTH
jgi:hypothetical protein